MAMNEMDMNQMPDESGMKMTMQMQELTKPTDVQDPIEMIKSDHRKVADLFEQFEGTEDKRQKLEITKQVCLELKVHATLEEELFYPLLKKEEEEVEEEAEMEHELIKFMISEVEGLRDKTLDPKMKVLKELVEHHVEEEEKEALPELEDSEELKSMSEEIMNRKQELMTQLSRGKKTVTRKFAAKKATTKKSSTRKSSTSTKQSAAGRKGGKAKASSARKSTTARKSTGTRKAASSSKSKSSRTKSTSSRGKKSTGRKSRK